MYRSKTVREIIHRQERERMAWDRERKELLDRIMYLVEKPWMLPAQPAPERAKEEEPLVYPESSVFDEVIL